MEHLNLDQLSTFGAMAKDVFKLWGIDDQVFNKALEEFKDEEPLVRVSKATQAVQAEFLNKAPMWARFNFLSHMISKAQEDKADVDWSKVNELLEKNRNPYDFNAYDPITTFDEFFEAAGNCRVACVMGAWYKGTCKDCGETFYMSMNEVDFFAKKSLILPKRCGKCRNKRKGAVKETSKHEVKQTTEQPQKTAMAIAMEKAGYVSVEKYLDHLSD